MPDCSTHRWALYVEKRLNVFNSLGTGDDGQEILRQVLDRWKSHVNWHEPQQVAAQFTHDARFLGPPCYSVGREGVAAYYEDQPRGLAVHYRILGNRRLADNVVLGHVSCNMSFTDRPTVDVKLGLVIRRVEECWYISHCQVCPGDCCKSGRIFPWLVADLPENHSGS
jgi:hypothetical protein